MFTGINERVETDGGCLTVMSFLISTLECPVLSSSHISVPLYCIKPIHFSQESENVPVCQDLYLTGRECY